MPSPDRPPSVSTRSRKSRRSQRYELREHIGTGGMGTVYRALDRELNRTVAVKLLRPELVPDLRNLLRLKRELVLASRVSDEHVVRVHDIGEVDGRPLIAMDWVEGESLAHLLSRVHCLPPSQTCAFAVQICQALRAIHAANIIHRDLKPGNLLIRTDGEILLGDFGLARSRLPQDFSLTGVGECGGTPRYMAPEQLAGLPADARSDLHALGIVLLEMLTGTTALEALASLRPRWLASQVGKDVRSGELRKLAALDLVIRRCLCLDRTERYASADAVLQDLRMADVAVPIVRSDEPAPGWRMLRSVASGQEETGRLPGAGTRCFQRSGFTWPCAPTPQPGPRRRNRRTPKRSVSWRPRAAIGNCAWHSRTWIRLSHSTRITCQPFARGCKP